MNQDKNTGLIAGIIGLTVLLFAGLVWLVARAPSDPVRNQIGQPEKVTFEDEGAPSIGPTEAKVVAHLYSDFQCPACKYSEPVLKTIIDTYKDRVRFVWKDFPLEQIHKNARAAANAARCAQDQGKFWEFHDQLYDTQSDWESLSDPATSFLQSAKALSLNEQTYTSCYTARANNERVSRNVSEGLANNVDRTPTFFINNRRYFGMNAQDWSKALDQALQEAATSTPTTK